MILKHFKSESRNSKQSYRFFLKASETKLRNLLNFFIIIVLIKKNAQKKISKAFKKGDNF